MTQGSRDVANCVNYLPEESDSYPSNEYRWSPATGSEVTQLGYVATQADGDEWRVLDSIVLKGASALTVAATASIAFALSF